MNSRMVNAEYVWTEIRVARQRPFVVGGLYRPPSESIPNFIDELDDELQRLPPDNTETYLLGDVSTQRGTELLLCTGDHGMHQLITQATRTTATSTLTIYLIFTSHPENLVNSGVTPLGITDHDLVCCVKKSKS